MSRELIYQFLLSVALFKFAFSSCYTQLCFRVCLKRLGIIQSLYFLAIGLGQLHYAALRGVTLRCRIGSSHPHKNDYSTNTTYGFRYLGVYKSVKRKCARIVPESVIKLASYADWFFGLVTQSYSPTKFVDEEDCVTSAKNVCVGGHY